MLVEHALNVMGLGDAVHAEYGGAGVEIISQLACSLDGVDIEVILRPGTRLRSMHRGASAVSERTTCNYGLNPAFRDTVETGGLLVSGADEAGDARAVERVDHPFFIATLYQPQLQSTVTKSHPVLHGFIEAIGAST